VLYLKILSVAQTVDRQMIRWIWIKTGKDTEGNVCGTISGYVPASVGKELKEVRNSSLRRADPWTSELRFEADVCCTEQNVNRSSATEVPSPHCSLHEVASCGVCDMECQMAKEYEWLTRAIAVGSYLNVFYKIYFNPKRNDSVQLCIIHIQEGLKSPILLLRLLEREHRG
jgi:hypothetical protein